MNRWNGGGRVLNQDRRWGTILSLILHAAVIAGLVFYFRGPLSTQIVAAGEGSSAGEGAIEVGVIEARQLGLSAPRSVSLPGEEVGATNNEALETVAPSPPDDAELLPATERSRRDREARPVERPTARQTEQLVTPTPQRSGSPGTNVEVGRSSGSQIPSVSGGIGIGGGSGTAGNGVPGGSEYGRRIQMILSRNYNPPAVAATGVEYVVVQLRVARDGRILSLVNGRVAPNYFKRRSAIDLVNYAAERAVIASNPLPALPNGFLLGAQEATAEIWFRYPR